MSAEVPSSATRCSACGASVEARPYCPRDGHLVAGPFSIGGGRYLVEERLGMGGMAFVFAGRHLALERPVAVKILRPGRDSTADAARFAREARIGSRLVDERITAILDFGHDAQLDTEFLVMERVHGRDLGAILREEGALSWPSAVEILAQIALALDHAHREGIAHRDLKPSNVLVDSHGRIKLCDFGVSRAGAGESTLTAAGEMVGTPAYMAPEQIRGAATQDARVDVYALGTLAYELLGGARPFEADTPVALIASKLRDRPVPLRERWPTLGIPGELDALVQRCLAEAPEDRPSASGAHEALLALARPSGAAARRRARMTLGIGAVAIAVALAVALLRTTSPSPASLRAVASPTAAAPAEGTRVCSTAPAATPVEPLPPRAPAPERAVTPRRSAHPQTAARDALGAPGPVIADPFE